MMVSAIKPKFQELFSSVSPKCKSQLGQEIFALNECDFKRGGYFVEFGATNGLDLSNTHLLEKEFGWSGILAEPAKLWHEHLQKNRDCIIDHRCVWLKSGEALTFHESEHPEFSTIHSLAEKDMYGEYRKVGRQYPVTTVSLEDLLRQHSAPKNIDYLSIDTEGSEYEILSSFDFDAFEINAITCEHNYTPDRELIYRLLTSKGFFRINANNTKWDDWYTKRKPVLLYV
jgi:FkbM family methyltransferase